MVTVRIRHGWYFLVTSSLALLRALTLVQYSSHYFRDKDQMLETMADQATSLSTLIKLNNGLSMPQIHLGVYLMSGSEASKAVTYALDAGYRAVDSAQMYRNEKQVGQSILDYLKSHPELKREDIHYTTKLASNSDYERARQSISKSVKECGLGYVDLFLLHSPYGGRQARLESWRAVEDAIQDGEVKIGGVSNFGEKHVSICVPMSDPCQ
jgi:diketogulonate reductase-like aldo/keto reductase